MQNYIKKLGVLLLLSLALISLNAQTVTDIEGNIYKTVTIGNQTWMAENLAVTKYRDGKEIPNITGKKEWEASLTGAYCWHNNDVSNKTIYGALYNWYAVKSKICPTGWHAPSYNEFSELITYLGGDKVAANKLKEAGTTHWKSNIKGNNEDADNSSGFTALPGSRRGVPDVSKRYDLEKTGYGSFFWSTVGSSANTSHYVIIFGSTIEIKTYGVRTQGFSVRCLKD